MDKGALKSSLEFVHDELHHAISHAVNDLDFDPWDEYENSDIELIKDKVENAKAQLKYIQEKYLRKCLNHVDQTFERYYCDQETKVD